MLLCSAEEEQQILNYKCFINQKKSQNETNTHLLTKHKKIFVVIDG